MELLLWLPFAALCLATIACQVGYMDDAKNRGGAIAPTGLRSKPIAGDKDSDSTNPDINNRNG